MKSEHELILKRHNFLWENPTAANALPNIWAQGNKVVTWSWSFEGLGLRIIYRQKIKIIKLEYIHTYNILENQFQTYYISRYI